MTWPCIKTGLAHLDRLLFLQRLLLCTVAYRLLDVICFIFKDFRELRRAL